MNFPRNGQKSEIAAQQPDGVATVGKNCQGSKKHHLHVVAIGLTSSGDKPHSDPSSFAQPLAGVELAADRIPSPLI
jgi:hypothetical protein